MTTCRSRCKLGTGWPRRSACTTRIRSARSGVNPHSDAAWSYLLDAESRLVETSAGWDEFALANHAPDVVSARVVGTPLRDHVHDPETRHIPVVIVSIVIHGVTATPVMRRIDAMREAAGRAG